MSEQNDHDDSADEQEFAPELEDADWSDEQESEETDNESETDPSPLDHTLITEAAPTAGPPARNRFTGAPRGIRRGDQSGFEIIDGLAGRSSVFGFGFASVADAIMSASQNYLGDASCLDRDLVKNAESSLSDAFAEFLGGDGIRAQSVTLLPSADAAIERMLILARARSNGTRYRTIAMVGSDHGRTAMCRTASGRPELHDGLGPMMAGFAHAPMGDLDAVKSMIDDQTGCILICPIDFASAAMAMDSDFIDGLRQLCDQHDLLLAVDETRLMFGASGTAFTLSSISNSKADLVAVSAGLFAGMPGGLVIANSRVGDTASDNDNHPMLAAVAMQTIESMFENDWPEKSAESAKELAMKIAETISMFEFVRDVHATGLTIGIETDIESATLVRAAAKRGLRIEAAGDLGVRVQLPLKLSPDDQSIFIDRLGETMRDIETATAEMSA
ncbi:MAG: aminotransferase class III-fold pyridoxal phosphate-dependent enzyme [Rubripirellula sp.]